MQLRHRGKEEAEKEESTENGTTSGTISFSSCETTSDVSSEADELVRVWPPVVVEAPSWDAGLDDESDEPSGVFNRRLLHWGPIIAIFIIAFISAVTTYFTMLWWPIDTVSGFLHFSVFMMWNMLTLLNLNRASQAGAGFVPLKWRPPKKDDEQRLQWCTPCEGFKAPRSHHCSKCGRCTMKMDHHCPWINNCVGHRNHAWFVWFLSSAILGCVHAIIIQGICFYHAIHMSWYLHYGDGSAPVIPLTLPSLLALVAASAFSFGVALGLSMLLIVQLKYIWRNQTGIEQYIDTKASNRRDDFPDLPAWIYPYNLGWRRNVKEVLCSWTGVTRGNGIWWPVVEECHQFTLTEEQLRQKELKRGYAKLVEITDDFKGGICGSCSMGVRVFCCQPISDEPRVKVSKGEEWVITRGQRHWFYGHKKGNEKLRGWFPRKVAVLTDRRPYDD